MDETEIARRFQELRTQCVNVIGFHELAEQPRDEVCRTIYQAQAYAGGIALARTLATLMADLEQGFSD